MNVFGRSLNNQPFIFSKDRLFQKDSGEGKTEYYELYILSYEEPKKDDWFIREGYPRPILQGDEFISKGDKKIIATTNLELQALKFRGTPLEAPSKVLKGCKVIGQDFIEDYVKEYNAGNVIKEVMVEYQKACCKNGYILINCLNTCKDVTYTLKLRPDNTIIIHKVKEHKITEHEMHLNMQYYMEHCQRDGYVTPQDWIKNHKRF